MNSCVVVRCGRWLVRGVLVAAAVLGAMRAGAAALPALFEKLPDPAQVRTTDAIVTAVPGGLDVTTGHQEPWPGIALRPSEKTWDLSTAAALVAEVENRGTGALELHLRVDNPGADGSKNCITRQISVPPGQKRSLRIALGRTDVKLFGMRGYPPESYQGIDPAQVTGLIFFVNHPKVDQHWVLQSLTLEAGLPAGTPFFPFIDTFGQYIHRDWPGKVHALEELPQRRAAEERDLAAHPGPAGWDVWGGWQDGPSLPATGFFRTEKVQGQWWLVDPDGRLFFSQGIDCVLERDITPVAERQDWFQDFPGTRPEFKGFSTWNYALHGYYAGKTPQCFSFMAANLWRKYGTDWSSVSRVLAHQRLRSWGLNTIGNWSEPSVAKLDKTPYVTTLGTHGARMIEGSAGYWGKFPDPFAPEFKDALARQLAKQARLTARDPWCLGYFVDNEMSWGNEVSLALGALQSPPDQPCKKVFIGDLQAKYGSIEKLNAAWGTAHGSWDDLAAARTAPDKNKAAPDLEAFYTRVAVAYFSTVQQALRQAAPQQLYLGCRFAWVNPRAVQAAAKYCDVISFNIYKHNVAEFTLPPGVDRPTIIGEFHFGALDRGLFHTGLVATASQADRAQAYTDYVHSVLRHPNFVGCHWFKYSDEPTTGRSHDEENYQIGFVDAVDTPYPEIVQAARHLGAEMYGYRGAGILHP